MTIDPKWRFAISLFVTLAIGISSGTLVLTNAIPAEYIPHVTAWCGIIAFLGSSANTTISGLGMTNASRNASVTQPNTVVVQTDSANAMTRVANVIAAMPEVKTVVATPELAAATPSDKVVPPLAKAA